VTSPGAAATSWIDGLQPAGAQALLGYDHPHFSPWAALTSRAYGAGTVTYVGTVPNPVLAADIARWATERRADGGWQPASESQTVTGAHSRDGTQLRFVHNWSWMPSEFVLPAAVRDVLGDEKFEAGDILQLGAWDVRVLVEN
jgi:beta-galactosidase